MAGIELATAYVSLVPSLQGAQGAIANEFNGVGDQAGGVFSGAFAGTFLGNIAGGLFEQAGRAIGTLLGTGFSEAAEAEVANAQLSAAIASTGNAANVSVGSLNALASSIQAYSGQTDDSIAATQALLLRFQSIKNVGPDKIFDLATVAAADMAARLGGDAASQAQKLGRALEDPIAGVAALSRAGVVFTDQQKAQIAAMVESGDLLGAQKLILAEVNEAYGGSAAAFGGTWTGTVERVKRAFEDFTQGALQGLLPIFTPIANGVVAALQSMVPAAVRVGEVLSSGVGKAIEFLGPVFQQIASTVGPLIGQFVALWSSISPLSLIFQAIQPLLPQLLSSFSALATTVGGALGSAFTQLLPVFQQLGGVVAGVLTQALSTLLPVVADVAQMLGPILATVIAAVVPIIQQLAPIFVKIVEAIMPLVGAALPLLTPLLELVAALLEPVIGLLVAIVSPILDLISPLIDLLAPALEVVIDVLVFIVKGITDLITWQIKLVTSSEAAGEQLDAVWSAILGFFGGVWDGIIGFFSGGVTQALGFVTGLRDQVVNVLRNAGTWLLDSGKAIIQGFIDGIRSMIGAVGDAVGGVMDFVAGFFPHSPAERGPFSGRGWSQVRESGLALGNQFGAGIGDSATSFYAQVTAAPNGFRAPRPSSADYDFDDDAAASAALGDDGPTRLAREDLDYLIRGLAALLRNQGRDGGLVNG